MYKFIGIGLLAFLALLIIPVSSATQSDDPSMYGTATIALKDKSGNILFENQIHNEVVNQGTASMMVTTFENLAIPGAGFLGSGQNFVDGLCVSNAVSFSIADTENFTTFNAANTIDIPFAPCNDNITFILTDTSASTGVQSFVAHTAFAPGTIITGIGVCGVDPFIGLIGCNDDSIGTSAVLLGVIDIADTAVPLGSRLDVSYTLILD